MSEPEFNPIVQAAMLEAVENQLRDDDPPETKLTYERLLGEGFSSEEVKEMIAIVLIIEMSEMFKGDDTFNVNRFVKMLELLPQIPGEE